MIPQPNDRASAIARALYERWEADRRETYRLAAMKRAVDAIDHWYVTHDSGIKMDVMKRALGEQALERLDEFCKTVAEMVAADKSPAEIGKMAVRAAEEWVGMHSEAQENFGK